MKLLGILGGKYSKQFARNRYDTHFATHKQDMDLISIFSNVLLESTRLSTRLHTTKETLIYQNNKCTRRQQLMIDLSLNPLQNFRCHTLQRKRES